jgi:hypothetical protein
MPLDLFSRTDIFTILTHQIFSLKSRKAFISRLFYTLTYLPLTSIPPSPRALCEEKDLSNNKPYNVNKNQVNTWRVHFLTQHQHV